MTNTITLNHIAIQSTNKHQTELFFTKILNLSKTKSFKLSKTLSKNIFNIDQSIDVDVYANNHISFEVFHTNIPNTPGYTHICLEVPSKKHLQQKCQQYNLPTNTVNRNGYTLLFIHDFAGNLYEIKEKPSL